MLQKLLRVDSSTTNEGIMIYFSELRNSSQMLNQNEIVRTYDLLAMNDLGYKLESIFPFRDDKNLTYQVALFTKIES